MSTLELFSLPVGTRVAWPVWDTTGVVLAREGETVAIVWEDGQEVVITPHDEDLVEFARDLEAVGDGGLDLPLTVYRRMS